MLKEKEINSIWQKINDILDDVQEHCKNRNRKDAMDSIFEVGNLLKILQKNEIKNFFVPYKE